MPRTGRPPNRVPPGSLHVTIPQDILDFLNLMTADPLSGEPIKGARTALLDALLRSLRDAYVGGGNPEGLRPALALLHTYSRGERR